MKHTLLASLTLALLFTASSANAQATRTWVSGVGDDVNPCSRTAPCKTFAGAISKTAAGGEINALDPGGFGAVTITKAITIDGGGTFASILSGGTNGIVININPAQTPPATVRLRNLSLNGAGPTLGLNGVNVVSAVNLEIENLKIFNYTQQGIKFTPSSATNSKLVVKGTNITSAAGGAITIAPTGGGTTNAELVNVTAAYSLHGLKVQERGLANVIDSHFVENAGPGVNAVSATAGVFAAINLKDSVLTSNQTGALTGGAASAISLSNVSVTLNGTGLSAPTGSIISFGNNQFLSNTVPGAPTATISQQ